MAYEVFNLVLMVTHACNLRCTYCYTGPKHGRTMPAEIGRRAIDRAVASIRPGGTLELGFFGGEPLLEAERIDALIGYAQAAAASAGVGLRVSLTTNGTLAEGAAWRVMTRPEVEVSVSHDGLPDVHDRHRRRGDGRGTSAQVVRTIQRLQDSGRDVRVVSVVRPDTVARLPEGMRWLRRRGVRRFDPTLDLWTAWSQEAGRLLAGALAECADLWVDGLPGVSLSWFDEKAGQLAGVPAGRTARCGFGDGQIAVAPSGRLYPCERLIGEDGPANPMRLAGHALEGEHFCRPATPGRSAESCAACGIEGACNTTCRCSNYVRTGDVRRPDGLLCLLNQVCYRETARVLADRRSTSTSRADHELRRKDHGQERNGSTSAARRGCRPA